MLRGGGHSHPGRRWKGENEFRVRIPVGATEGAVYHTECYRRIIFERLPIGPTVFVALYPWFSDGGDFIPLDI